MDYDYGSRTSETVLKRLPVRGQVLNEELLMVLALKHLPRCLLESISSQILICQGETTQKPCGNRANHLAVVKETSHEISARPVRVLTSRPHLKLDTIHYAKHAPASSSETEAVFQHLQPPDYIILHM